MRYALLFIIIALLLAIIYLIDDGTGGKLRKEILFRWDFFKIWLSRYLHRQ
jgi:hypothetical protein